MDGMVGVGLSMGGDFKLPLYFLRPRVRDEEEQIFMVFSGYLNKSHVAGCGLHAGQGQWNKSRLALLDIEVRPVL